MAKEQAFAAGTRTGCHLGRSASSGCSLNVIVHFRFPRSHQPFISGNRCCVAHLNASSLESAIPFVAGVIGILIGFGKGTTARTFGSENARRILRWLSPALIVFAIFLFVSNVASESADAEIIVTGMKAKMKLPAQVDDNTRIDDVRAISKREVGYFLTLTKMTKVQLDANPIAKQLESNLRRGACQNENYTRLFKAGISLSVTYQTRDQAEVVRIVLAPKDCGF
jgi:hypothetical protein